MSKSWKVYTVNSRKSEQTFIESVGVFLLIKNCVTIQIFFQSLKLEMWIEIPYLRSKSGKVYTVKSLKSELTFTESEKIEKTLSIKWTNIWLCFWIIYIFGGLCFRVCIVRIFCFLVSFCDVHFYKIIVLLHTSWHCEWMKSFQMYLSINR